MGTTKPCLGYFLKSSVERFCQKVQMAIGSRGFDIPFVSEIFPKLAKFNDIFDIIFAYSLGLPKL
jgi:hypothetical protein